MWHVPCPPALTQRQMLDLIYAAAGHETKFRALPPFMATAIGWFVPIMRELAEMQYQWLHDYDFRCDRFTAAFGGEVVEHAVGVKRTLEWFAAHPKT